MKEAATSVLSDIQRIACDSMFRFTNKALFLNIAHAVCSELILSLKEECHRNAVRS
jgi:hypothetical protein